LELKIPLVAVNVTVNSIASDPTFDSVTGVVVNNACASVPPEVVDGMFISKSPGPIELVAGFAEAMS
jgi:hypothetical protein